MKKLLIFMALMLTLSSFAIASDFSDNYFQKRIYDGTAQDSELLRSTYTNTALNVDDVSYGLCSVGGGGSRFNSVPVAFTNSNTGYSHNSLVVPYTTSIVQYGSDCTILDTYTVTDGNIISNIGYTGAYYDGSDLIMPTFAVIKYDTGDTNTYMMMFTLNTQTSKLELTKEVLLESGLSDPDDVFGVVGGCYESNNVVCSLGNRVFGMFSTDNDNIYIVGYGTSWTKNAQYNVGETYIDATDSKNMLFLRDYNDDGSNEFLLFGAYVSSNRVRVNRHEIQPIKVAPFYIDNGVENENIMVAGTSVSVSNTVQYQSITPCQVDNIDDELETCFSINKTDTGSSTIVAGYLPNPYNGYATLFGNGNGLTPFTYDVDGSVSYDRHVCVPTGSGGNFRCYDSDGNINKSFTLNDQTNMANDLRLEVLVTEANGDTSSPEILFSNGEMENINFSGVNNVASDWANLDDTYYGSFYAQDISNDGKSEIVYIDDNILRIYTMDNTPFVFLNYTDISGSVPENESGVPPLVDPDSDIEDLIENINTNKNQLFGIFIIAAFVIGTAIAGISNPIVLMFVGILGSIFAFIMGLITTGVMVLIVMFAVILMIMYTVLFKVGD